MYIYVYIYCIIYIYILHYIIYITDVCIRFGGQFNIPPVPLPLPSTIELSHQRTGTPLFEAALYVRVCKENVRHQQALLLWVRGEGGDDDGGGGDDGGDDDDGGGDDDDGGDDDTDDDVGGGDDGGDDDGGDDDGEEGR